jgi:transmembrane sensor
MTSKHINNDAHAIKQQAFDWLIRLNEAADTSTLRTEFEAWLATSPEHALIWDKTCLMWASMGEAPQFEYRRSPMRPVQRRSRRAGKIFAVATGAIMSLCLAYIAIPALQLHFEADYQTGTAESRTITLEDGSSVDLGPGSAIATDFSAGQRNVRLLAGEAYFDVVHDISRPFHVLSRDIDVRVLGTAFNVRVSDVGTEVGLERGSVQATGSVANHTVDETLVPGELVSVDRETGQTTKEEMPLADIGAWRGGRLIAVDATIGSIVEQIRRYHPSWIAIPDRRLANLRVSGVYNLNDPDKALVALVAPYGGEVRKVSGLARLVTGF